MIQAYENLHTNEQIVQLARKVRSESRKSNKLAAPLRYAYSLMSRDCLAASTYPPW